MIARWTLPLAAAMFALWGAVVAPAGARAATPRPPDGGSYGYTTAEAPPFSSQRAVVHYTTAGPDRPPRRDTDGDGVPDYVEIAGAAADDALYAFFRFLYLRRPVPDAAGGDPRPDIYIKTLPGGGVGRAVPPRSAVGGAFVVVAPSLDMRATGAGIAIGLRQQVAHELGHLVQFAYVPGGMPSWLAEGSANLMATAGVSLNSSEPLDDLVIQYAARYAIHPERSLDDPENAYGATLWWFLLARQGALPGIYLRLAEQARAGGIRRNGLAAIGAAVRAVDLVSLRHAFFAYAVRQLQWLPVPPREHVAAALGHARTVDGRVAPLATHTVALEAPRAAELDVRVAFMGRAVGTAALVQGRSTLRSGDIVPLSLKKDRLAVPLRRGRVTHWRVPLRGAKGLRRLTLLIAGAAQRPGHYTITTRAYTHLGAPPALTGLVPEGWTIRPARRADILRLPRLIRPEVREAAVVVDPSRQRYLAARYGAQVTDGVAEHADLRLSGLESSGLTDGAMGYDVVRLRHHTGYTFVVPDGRRAQGAWWMDRRPPPAVLARLRARGHRGFLYEQTLGKERGPACESRSAAVLFRELPSAPQAGVSRREAYACGSGRGRVAAVLMDVDENRDALRILKRFVDSFGARRTVTLSCGTRVAVSRARGRTVAFFGKRHLLLAPDVFVFAAADLRRMEGLLCRVARRA